MQNLRTHHLALEVHQRQRNRTVMEVRSQRHLLARVIDKGSIQRQRLIQPLHQSRTLQKLRHLLRRRTQRLLLLRIRTRRTPQRQNRRHQNREPPKPDQSIPPARLCLSVSISMLRV